MPTAILPKSFRAISLPIAWLCFQPIATLAQEAVRTDQATRESGPIENLRRIEKAILPPTIVAGPAKHGSLGDYYCQANPELCDRFDQARDVFASGKQRPYRAMTVVSGSAGVGKTFVKRQIYREIPSDRVWKFDVRELFQELAQQNLAELKPDLQHGDRVFNRLLSLRPGGREALADTLRDSSAAFVVVDSLDEIHPDDYSFVLQQLEQMSLDGDRDFIHLVVLGRPLAFRDYWKSRVDLRPRLRGFLLNKPEFRTIGDLALSNWNYDCWRFSLDRGPSDARGGMSFEDYQRWTSAGCRCEGEFADVVFDENAHMAPAAREQLLQWSTDFPVVASVLANLAANGMVRDILADHIERGERFDERQFMNDFLAAWLERDTRSDDRPSRLKPEHLDLYLRLLEAIAAKYVAEDRVSETGYFEVTSSDRVSIDVMGESVAVPVRPVLNRSGLVTVDPRDPVSDQFRFEPFWFHRLLVEMHQERKVDDRVNAFTVKK